MKKHHTNLKEFCFKMKVTTKQQKYWEVIFNNINSQSTMKSQQFFFPFRETKEK